MTTKRTCNHSYCWLEWLPSVICKNLFSELKHQISIYGRYFLFADAIVGVFTTPFDIARTFKLQAPNQKVALLMTGYNLMLLSSQQLSCHILAPLLQTLSFHRDFTLPGLQVLGIWPGAFKESTFIKPSEKCNKRILTFPSSSFSGRMPKIQTLVQVMGSLATFSASSEQWIKRQVS